MRLVAAFAAAGSAVLLIGSGWIPTHGSDAVAYQLAAERLRSGLPLYPAMSADAAMAYRYAPWFAVVWIPLSYLPTSVSLGLLTLAACAAVAYMTSVAWRLGGHVGVIFGILMFAQLGAAPGGNIGPIMTAIVVWALPRRWGPLAIGLYASLKIYPILLVAGYLAERRWREACTAIGVAVVLWLPAIWFGLDYYIHDPGGGGISLYALSPALWAAVAVGLLGATGLLAMRGSRWTWVAAAASIPLAPPRVFAADVGYLLAGARRLTLSSLGGLRSR
jgi:hypothetical protein